MILIFAGAGASKAVDPEQYPTTVEFFQQLPPGVTSDKLFESAVAYLDQTGKSATIDIEQVLWTLKELKDFTATAADSKSVAGWFMKGNRLTSATGSAENLQPIINVASPATVKIDQLASRINQVVYDLYAEVPEEKNLSTNWLPLLTNLMKLKEPIEIVTTNYDMVIEEAITLSNAPVNAGRNQKIQPVLETQLWDLATVSGITSSSVGLLTKLHGSVDWVRGRRNLIHVGTPTYQGNHEKHAIIYPGFKGEPTDELFQRLHVYFQLILPQANIIVFIGYAFRDQYINTLLARGVRADADILVLNPAKPLPTIPFAKKNYQHFAKPFDNEGVDTLLGEIDHALNLRSTKVT